MASSKVTVSAGGVVLNREGMVLVVNNRGRSWSLPKGHVDPGEDPLTAARREITEETGIKKLQGIRPLGAYGRYKIGLKSDEDKQEWKVLIFFLFTTKEMKLLPQDPVHPEARWIHPDKVPDLLTHRKDKAFFRNIRLQLSRP